MNQYFREGDHCVGGIGRMNEAMGGWVGGVGAWVNGRVKGESKLKNGWKQASKQ